MGKYDDITEGELKSHLTRFARMVLRAESRGTLLDSLPDLMRFLGELRRMVFAYEVRGTRKDGEEPSPSSPDVDRHDDADPTVRESLRVVEDAVRRARELQERLQDGLLSDDPDDE